MDGSAPQQQVIVQAPEQPGFWSSVDKVLTELLQDDISPAILILVVACIMAPMLIRWWWRWQFGPGKTKGNDDA